ncbi:S-formylglutathione hydrolase [Saliniradius amylolyticus]|uniref:S-formylglutathione hydrolase n=1 Tax=Saliniradius amylolyticus TaxID=2183582 RepID=A0A2S2E1G5_9ALTE|nr:S-formylglutathione hydrolase [Saliniradius amylolyticus]AWL11473.1 S-formylglutathione hydrolase [Saliniradius amylolyticus]
MAIEKLSEVKCFGGWQQRFQHQSDCLSCTMTFSVYLPPQAEQQMVPVIYWLSGLTCTDENFSTKSGAQRYAAEHGVALVMPDTSPRGDNVPDDPDGAFDFGLGAGFYVNATQSPWKAQYQMFDYVHRELPQVVESQLPVSGRKAISGHSMGGHGALVIGLTHPQDYKAISAFAPVCNPTQCPWGKKAFSNYLGDDRATWKAYDASERLDAFEGDMPILVDQGTADNFLKEQLGTPALEAANQRGLAEIRYQEGYDHSYYFIASFIGEHITFLAKALKG